MALNETHDPLLHSWVAAANVPGADFTLQNLPLGVFRRAGSSEVFRGGVAIGDQILDLAAARRAGVMDPPAVEATAAEAARAAAQPVLNELMAAGPSAWSALRLALSRALRSGSPHQTMLQSCLLPQAQAQFALPAHIGDYTDFYTSIYHATAVGKLFRPDNPLLPNYKWMPIAYHGRSSSIGISGQQFQRPSGQMLAAGETTPIVAPSQRLDYELELGVFIGRGNALGTPIGIESAESSVFGLCLLNDWSARDLQAWEYQPLGPFLGKNFATTISPWIVTLEALEPYRVAWTRPAADPQPLAYLDSRQLRLARRDRHSTRVPAADRSACAAQGRLRGACRAAASGTPTGTSRRWWRTTPSTVATCGRAICLAPARNQGRSLPRPDRCWNCRSEASSH